MDISKIDDNAILRLSIDFAVAAIEYCEMLEAERKYVVSRQLLKSATAIGANAMEAQNAESKPDFIHKMKIAAKESDETGYWLLLCTRSRTYPGCGHLVEKQAEISKVLNSIIGTSKRRSPFSYFISMFL